MISVLEVAPIMQNFSKESLTSKRILDGSIENFAIRPLGIYYLFENLQIL